ncbi:hypothetical protein F5141DRAFT_1093816 [Pisolithus sp. B1]|nr:hypothetical protein F5141DRAFT_1093816 [Pisolithus sp. B1]
MSYGRLGCMLLLCSTEATVAVRVGRCLNELCLISGIGSLPAIQLPTVEQLRLPIGARCCNMYEMCTLMGQETYRID